ncbi:flotillin-1-like isoform X2 [Rhopilema esculentum]|uniref:flotillin-1-like isoform X2 n=1 Tax=Rhopilema esculentum TaxID=499914 RepID=UPI0031E1E882
MCFESCGPNEAMVVSGACRSRPLHIVGGRVFVWPKIQRVQRMDLNVMTLNVESVKVRTVQGIPITVTAIAEAKIQGMNFEMLKTACELFLGKSTDEVRQVVLETLEGHQSAIIGTMTVEEIYQDRKKFSKSVFEVASSDLVNMGISVISYTLKDIRDEEGHLLEPGMKRTGEVQTEAKMESGIMEASRDKQEMN